MYKHVGSTAGAQGSPVRPRPLLYSVGKVWIAAFAVFLLGLLVGCLSPSRGRSELLVFAAASLTDALSEIGQAFEAQSEIGIAFSYGGSQELAQQIASGAPADLFIPAGEFPMEFLADKGKIEREAMNLLSNKLVVVTRTNGVQIEKLEQLNTDIVERIAIADPDLAPAGGYARESLTRLGLWDELQGKLIIGADVRVTLAYLESGNVDIALVYKTDARVASNVNVLDLVPSDSYSSVVYPAVVVRRSEKKAEADEFLEFLRSEAAAEIFLRHGFEPLQP